jgi:hypothetical protein
MKNYSTLFVRAAAIAIVISLLALPAPAWACSCIFPPQPPLAYADAAAVFTGKVVGIDNPSQSPFISQIVSTWVSWTNIYPDYSFYQQHVTFEVQDSWKGVTTTAVTVQTGSGGGDCGYYFGLNQQYVVYAYQSDNSGLNTNICTRTTDISQAGADLTYLKTLPSLTLTPYSSSNGLLLAGALGVAAVLVGGGGWFVWRRIKSAKPETQKAE